MSCWGVGEEPGADEGVFTVGIVGDSLCITNNGLLH